MEPRDHSLDTLLELDGQVFVVDPGGRYWVKLMVKRVPVTPERPQGIRYSLTLHDESNARLVGFDNAHSLVRGSGPGGGARAGYDHRHRLATIRPYQYRDAATLLADFWAEVDAVLREKGVIP